MDPTRFDRLVRSLAQPASRRRALGALLGGAALASRLAGLAGADGVAAAKRRKAVPGAGNGPRPAKVLLCHQGHPIEVAEPAVPAHLNHGDTLGPCGGLGAGTCVPLGQVCSGLPSATPCCHGVECRKTRSGATTCQLRCGSNATCQASLGSLDVECVKDLDACPGLLGCCRGKVCPGPSGTPCSGSGGPCCVSPSGGLRCCLRGQTCADGGGCAAG
jgi:hypothetical protein